MFPISEYDVCYMNGNSSGRWDNIFVYTWSYKEYQT